MQSIISAKFENFRYADKALSHIVQKYPKVYIAEQAPSADTNYSWQRRFVVPVNADSTRFVAIADTDEYSDEFSGAFVNVRCESKVARDIAKIIKNNMGSVINDINTK